MLIYAPFHDSRKWQREGLRTRDGHVARHLADLLSAEQVLVTDRPTCVAELVRLKGRWFPAGKRLAGGLSWRVTTGPTGSPTIDVLVPAIGFVGGSFHRWLIHAFTGRRYNERVRRISESLGGGVDDVLWLCHPFSAGMIDRWPNHRVVVDAFDNFAIHPELSPIVRADVREQYARLCNRAETIAVNSVAMQAWLWANFRRETTVVPNGADLSFFSEALPMALPYERPIIGYAGKLGRRIDVPLLLSLAAAMDRGTIVLAGQTLSESWMAPVTAHPRIRRLGDLRYPDLPGFLSAVDVCIVPHSVGEGENHGDATKIYEYLAAGKPTVTTAIGGTNKFTGRIIIADSKAAFIEAVLEMSRGARLVQGSLLPHEEWRARTQTLCRLFRVDTGTATQIP